ncbi:MAG: tyrosine-type recombinase/integrase [Chthoniobacterales bacterium]|nr:tyrosine-type recombinase/integrase [Chthoniobacterales bacterium]
MKRSESDSASLSSTQRPDHAGKFIAVRDSRNRRLAGLYQRNGRYYVQLWIDRGGKKTARRFPLLREDVCPPRNLVEAKEAAEIKRNDRRENKLPTAGLKPIFADYQATYLAKAKVQRKGKDTLYNERLALARWAEHLGRVRVDRIITPLIVAFLERRLAGGTFVGKYLPPVTARTANLDLIVLRNVLNAALDDGHFLALPRMKAFEEKPTPKRPLLTPTEFERLLESAKNCSKNGEQFHDYLRFLAFSGAREAEALRIRWADVDVEDERVTIGADGLAKNGEARTIEFNAHLGALLREMDARRAPDCAWLFPSPQRGARDEHARTFRESLLLARKRRN